MTSVAGVRDGVHSAGGTRRAVRASGFVLPDGPGVQASAGEEIGGAAAMAGVSLSGMLALQELEAEPVEDRAARRRGQDMLAVLSALQRALLAGVADSQALERLAELARAMPEPRDPRLREILGALMVRVHVELARRGL